MTGTDTGVGKTVVSAALMIRYRLTARAGGARLRYWKPVQTGVEQDDDTATVRHLGGCAAEEVVDEGVRLPRPVSPHLAARLAGRPIDVSSLVERAATWPPGNRWIVEGAGGVLVPLRETVLVVDLIARLALPALVVARSSLGTINHTLLTLEALRGRGVVAAGVVMVGPINPDNREAIEIYGQVAVVGQLPPLELLTPAALAAWAASDMDPGGLLEGYLR